MEWIFWILLGIVIGGLIVGLVQRWRTAGIQLTWYEWVLLVLGVIFAVFGIETLVHSLAEFQPQAGWMGLLFLAIPAVVFFVVLGRLVRARIPGA